MVPVDADIIAVARVFLDKYGRGAPTQLREIVARHRQEESEDAEFWALVAEMSEGLLWPVLSRRQW